MNMILKLFYNILNNSYTQITKSLLVLLLIFMMLKFKPFRYFIPIVMSVFCIYTVYKDYSVLDSCIYCTKSSCKVLCSNNYNYIMPAIIYILIAILFTVYDYLAKKYNKLDNNSSPNTKKESSDKILSNDLTPSNVPLTESSSNNNTSSNPNQSLPSESKDTTKIDTKFYN